MTEENKKSKLKNIVFTVILLLVLGAFLVVSIWMNHTDRYLYLAGCIWKPAEMTQLLLIVVWIADFFVQLRTVRRTEDPEQRQKLSRRCKHYAIFASILTALYILSAAMTFSEYRNTRFAELGTEPNRSILLEEGKYGGIFSVYQKKGILIRAEDSVKFTLYANQHVVADQQYTWESDGKTVTVRFETGGLGHGLVWDEASGEPEPPAFIEKQYALPD